MSEPGLSFDEEILSPDFFPDADTMLATNNTFNSEESSSTSIGANEPQPSHDIPEWKGMSMEEIRKGLGTYDCHELPPVCPSSYHTVLISLPLPASGPPKPYPTYQVDKWSQGYVRMPHSTQSLYPIDQSSHDAHGNRRCRNRWELIQESLLRSFVSSQQLETAILSYNHLYSQRWDFAALHHFFSEAVDEEERNIFFGVLLPKMIQLALQLPVLLTGPVPLLKSHTNGTITLSQLQVASLLANAFFCTFPRRNSTSPQSEYATYPYINFNRLFAACREDRRNRCESVMEKLKCLFHYFRRVTTKGGAAPEGVITIQRRYIPKEDCPRWDRQDQKLPPLHITSRGTIETEGAGLLQVDFANKYLGGAVLGYGCVQEEIRFAICPELIVTMLISEALDDTEALIVSGVERYSNYEGYSNDFKWTGDFVDETPKDSSGRRLTSIVAIDALRFKQPKAQFSPGNIKRELNKAYVGFVGCDSNRDNLPAIATGNWGCGAYHGNPKLKVLLQLMAAAVAGRSMVYFTFGDASLRDDISEMYWHFVQDNVDIAQLFSLLVQYQEATLRGNLDFYRFLYKRGKIKPLLKYFPTTNKSPPEASAKSLNIKREYCWNRETKFEKSKSLKNGDKRLVLSSIQTKVTEEEKIQTWLENFDKDFSSNTTTESSKREHEEHNNGMKVRESCTNEVTHSDVLKDGQSQSGDVVDRKKKLSFWKVSENKTQSKRTNEQRLSGLGFLDAKQELVPDQLSNDPEPLTTVKHQSSTDSSGTSNKLETDRPRNEHAADSHKQTFSTAKKCGQRKISDFFQRTS